MKNTWPNSLKNTQKAIKWYSAPLQVSTRQHFLDSIKDEKSMARWQAKENDDLLRVRKAFFEDTKDINSWDNCSIIDIYVLNDWCDKAAKQEKKCG